uniref:Putative ubiquitin-like protein n=1 Tax=Trypanosoma congolense (strain IL3000) TaxID=1068625 RepID=G0V042_TRYCI|nr:putative ubiquitin-like protein [Trypanosoma congolense IL3000]
MRLNITGAREEHRINNLEVDLEDGVEGLRRRVAERLQVSPRRIRLIHRGYLIDGSRPLDSFLEEGVTVHVVVSPLSASGRPSGGSGEHAGGSSESHAAEGLPSAAVGELLATWLGRLDFGVRGGVDREGVHQDTPVARVTGPGAREEGSPRETRSRTRLPQLTSIHLLSEVVRPTMHSGSPQHQARTADPTTVHVHVHVTLDELDELPQRLERFRRRLNTPAESVRNTSVHGPPGTQGATVEPRGSMAMSGSPRRRHTGDDRGSVGANQEEGLSDEALMEMLGRFLTRGPHASQGGVDGATDEEPDSLVRTLVRENWEALVHACAGDRSRLLEKRAAIVETTRLWIGRGHPVEAMTPESGRRRAEEDAAMLANRLWRDAAMQRAFEEEKQPGVDVAGEMKKLYIYAHGKFVEAIFNSEVDGEAWANGVEAVLLEAGKIAVSRAPTWFREGVASLGRLLALSAQTSFLRAMPPNFPVAQFAPLLNQMTLPLLQQLQEVLQYSSSWSAPDIFEETAQTSQEPPHQSDDEGPVNGGSPGSSAP